MRVGQAIEKRRSIRRFKDKKVEDDVIYGIIDAARMAPSGCNIQPTRFFVIKCPNLKNKLKKGKVFFQDWVYDASHIIVFCGNPDEYRNTSDFKLRQDEGSMRSNLTGIERYLVDRQERTLRDIAISSSFLVLKAQECGLGTCYVGLIDRKGMRIHLDIPDSYIIPFAVAVGYPDNPKNERFRKELGEMIIGWKPKQTIMEK